MAEPSSVAGLRRKFAGTGLGVGSSNSPAVVLPSSSSAVPEVPPRPMPKPRPPPRPTTGAQDPGTGTTIVHTTTVSTKGSDSDVLCTSQIIPKPRPPPSRPTAAAHDPATGTPIVLHTTTVSTRGSDSDERSCPRTHITTDHHTTSTQQQQQPGHASIDFNQHQQLVNASEHAGHSYNSTPQQHKQPVSVSPQRQTQLKPAGITHPNIETSTSSELHYLDRIYHLSKTSHHAPPGNPTKDRFGQNWIQFHRENGGSPLTTSSDCPCVGGGEDSQKQGKPAHGATLVGAHTAAILRNGDVVFGIVPVCNTCNSVGQFKKSRRFKSGETVEMVSLYCRIADGSRALCSECAGSVIVDDIRESSYPEQRLSDMFQTHRKLTNDAPDHVRLYRLRPAG